MKKAICFIAAMLCLSLAMPQTAAAKEKKPEVSEVSVVGEGTANNGRVLIAVTCAAKKANLVTENDLRSAALRCVLFRGWVDKSNTNNFDASTTHPAIAGDPDAETAHADYFRDFLSSGAAEGYVEMVPDTRKVMKDGKVYKVTQTVTVNTRSLRKKLEKDGIIKGLNRKW